MLGEPLEDKKTPAREVPLSSRGSCCCSRVNALRAELPDWGPRAPATTFSTWQRLCITLPSRFRWRRG